MVDLRGRRGFLLAAAFARLRTLRYSPESLTLFSRSVSLHSCPLARPTVDLYLTVVLGHRVTIFAVTLGWLGEPAAYLVGHGYSLLPGVVEPRRGLSSAARSRALFASTLAYGPRALSPENQECLSIVGGFEGAGMFGFRIT